VSQSGPRRFDLAREAESSEWQTLYASYAGSLQILARKYPNDSGRSLRTVQIDRFYHPMREIGPDERGVGLAFNAKVVGEAALAGDEALIFATERILGVSVVVICHEKKPMGPEAIDQRLS